MKPLATGKDPLQRATGMGAGVGERGEGNPAHIVQSWEGKGGLAFRSHRADRGCCFLFWGVGEGRQKLEVSALLPISVSPLTSGGSPGGLLLRWTGLDKGDGHCAQEADGGVGVVHVNGVSCALTLSQKYSEQL